MAKAKLYSADGSFKEDLNLPEAYFDAEVSNGCVYLTVKAHLANQRQGTSKAKSRSEVAGSGAKPWKQKGTGRARAGSVKSPIWVRGGKAHGPNPRKYTQKINKKVKQKALLSALTLKAQENSVHVFEALSYETPKTAAFKTIMENAQIATQKNLYLVADSDSNALKSASNLPWATVMRVSDVNTYVLLRANNVVFSQSSLNQLTGEA